MASTTVSVGRNVAPSSATARSIPWWSRFRPRPRTPNQFFIPTVARERPWCLATGTLITRWQEKRRSITSSPAEEPERLAGTSIERLAVEDVGSGRPRRLP